MMPAMNNTAPASPSATSVKVFGIPNCDTVKKARTWLTDHGVAHTFHDFKKLGVPTDLLPRWISAVGWEALVNRKGTTWRQLDAAAQARVVNAASASSLMLAHTSVVKRPVVVWANGAVTVGFDAASFAAHLP